MGEGDPERKLAEAVLNIANNITKASASNKFLATLAVDFSKAFDTVSMKFLQKMFEFYKFGPKFVKFAMTCTVGKSTLIKTEKGDYCPLMYVNRGVPQGDRLSPLSFILCIEILIAKLESNIPKLSWDTTFCSQYSTQCYADDITIQFEASRQVLELILDILEQFRQISGLATNLLKTHCLLTHNLEENDNLVDGFANACNEKSIGICKEIKILGFTIFDTYCLESTGKVWAGIIKKMKKIIGMWNVYMLSTEARIIVSKTFLYSQLAFTGSLYPIDQESLSAIADLISNFVNNNLKVPEHMVWKEKKEGGLGLFEVELFLQSIQANFIKKNMHHNDNWCDLLKNNCLEGIIELFYPGPEMDSEAMLLNQLAKAFNKFKNAFNEIDGNIFEANILFNDLIRDDEGNICKSIFDHANWERLKGKVKRLKFGKLLKWDNQGRISGVLDKHLLAHYLELDTISDNEFQDLRRLLMRNIRIHRKRQVYKKEEFMFFLGKKTTDSKSLRSILNKESNFENLSHVKYYRNKCLFRGPLDHKEYSLFSSLWAKSYIPCYMSEFCIKSIKNKILLADRRSHYSVTNRECHFCVKEGRLPPPSESVIHSFFYCNSVHKLWQEYNRLMGVNVESHNIFLGFSHNDHNVAEVINADILYGKYFIFGMIKDKRLYNVGSFIRYIRICREEHSKISIAYKMKMILILNLNIFQGPNPLRMH